MVVTIFVNLSLTIERRGNVDFVVQVLTWVGIIILIVIAAAIKTNKNDKK